MKLPRLGKPKLNAVPNFFMPVFWETKDNALVAGLMRLLAERVAPGFHFADNLFAWARNNSMLDDTKFVEASTKNAESDSDRAIIWRRYVLACAAFHCIHLDGDFVECGAYISRAQAHSVCRRLTRRRCPVSAPTASNRHRSGIEQ